MKIFWGICLILSSLSAEGARAATTINTTQLAKDLSSRLVALGSFQAEYQAVSPEKAGFRLIFQFSKRERYLLLKMISQDSEAQEVYAVLDFSKISGWRGDADIFLVSGNKGQKLSYSLRGVESLDNPIGVIIFAKKCLNVLRTLHTVKNIDVGKLVPTMTLELSEKELIGSLGFSTEVHRFAASWLDEETIKDAVEIEELEDAVRFSYQSDHEVWVDKETGLLLEDSFPNPDRPGPRKIILEKYSALDREVPYSLLIPGFQDIKFVESPQQVLECQLPAPWLGGNAVTLSSNDSLDEVLEQHSEAIAEAMQKLGVTGHSKGATIGHFKIPHLAC